jgi:hypothetical protein
MFAVFITGSGFLPVFGGFFRVIIEKRSSGLSLCPQEWICEGLFER